MNPLLQRPAQRRVTRVVLESHPEAEVYVRALTGAELTALFDKIRSKSSTTDNLAAQLEAYVSDAEGNATLKVGEGIAVLDAIDGIDVKRLVSAGDKLNILTEEAIEAERKN